jgi:hypothetical protein
VVPKVIDVVALIPASLGDDALVVVVVALPAG